MTRFLELVALVGSALVGYAYYDPGFVPALMERYVPETVLREGTLNAAIWDRGTWAKFALQGKKFYGVVYACRWSPTVTQLQWAYGEFTEQDGRFASRYWTGIAWSNLVKADKCVETGPVWYAVEDIRVSTGAYLHAYSPGQRHTAPGIAKIRIDGDDRVLYMGVVFPLLEGVSES
jgi:hypothetical protein